MLLPAPPSNEEKLLYLKQNKYFYYIPAVCSSILLLIGFLLFTFQHYSLLFFIPLVVVLFTYLFISYFIGLSPSSFNYDVHLKLINRVPAKYYPTIDILLPSCGEEICVLRNTYIYVNNLVKSCEYNIKVWVLDDSKRLQVKGLSEEFNFYYVTRPDNHMKKAGNLRYAFGITQGELFAIFDADFVPREDFFYETVPYFQDEKIAIVQTTQFFNVEKKMSLIEAGAGYVQELFYRLIQNNRNFYDAAICVGTNAVYRRSALTSFGGTAEIGYSEDMHTGFNVTKVGYKVKYLPLNLAKGICPEDLKTFFYQQYRWAMGSITLATNPNFWRSRLTKMQKTAYASGFLYYIATAVGLILNPLPGMIMLTFWPDKIFWYNYVFSLPSFVFTTAVYIAWSNSKFTYGFPIVRQVQYWAHLFALVDKARGNLFPWLTKTSQSDYRFLLFQRLNIVWFVSIFAVVTVGLARNVTALNWYHFLPLILVTTYNLSLSAAVWRLGYEGKEA